MRHTSQPMAGAMTAGGDSVGADRERAAARQPLARCYPTEPSRPAQPGATGRVPGLLRLMHHRSIQAMCQPHARPWLSGCCSGRSVCSVSGRQRGSMFEACFTAPIAPFQRPEFGDILSKKSATWGSVRRVCAAIAPSAKRGCTNPERSATSAKEPTQTP